MNLPTEIITLLYAKNLTRLEIEVQKNDKLLDKYAELKVDANHLRRQNNILSKLVLERDKQIEQLQSKLDNTHQTLVQTAAELQTTSAELAHALATYKQHA